MDKLFSTFFKHGVSISLSLLLSFYWGWAFMTLWGWFAVTGAGLAPITYPFWVGMTFMLGQASMWLTSASDFKKTEDTSWGYTIGVSALKVVSSLIALGFTWFVFLILL